MLALFATLAFEPARAADIRPVITMGYDFGGEVIATVTKTRTHGPPSEIKTRANEGLYVGGGMAIINNPIELDVTLAYKSSLGAAGDLFGDVDWSLWPLEALGFYRLGPLRVGGGLTYHIKPKLEGSDVASSIEFKNALGAVLQVDLNFGRRAIGVRYTAIEYEAKSPASGSAKANGFGVTFGAHF
jgi:hypothetical protein